MAATAGALVGLVLYLPVLAFAPDNVAELTIALTLHLPLLTAAVLVAFALRGHVPRPRRWALSWYSGGLFGVAVAWLAGGGLAGASTGLLHPVLESAVAYGWQMIPRSLLGALPYAAWTAYTFPPSMGEAVGDGLVQ